MIFTAFERMVAFRYLRARRREGFISVIAGFSLLGIGLGVATLIVVMAVMNGFRAELMNRILGLNGHLSVYAAGPMMNDYDALAGKILTQNGVVQAVPTIEGQVMAVGKGGTASGALVRGLPFDLLLTRSLITAKLQGDPAAFAGGQSVVIGRRLAEKLGLAPGDSITLISPKGLVTAFGMVPRMRAFTIAATFEAGMFEYDSAYVFMPLAAAQNYFQLPDQVNFIELFLTNPDMAPTVAGAVRGVDPTLRLYDWQRSNASFFNAVQVERNVMFLILTLIIVVAAFNIISSLIMLVKDKSHDIAILRTMGATRGMIMRIFLLSGASIGVAGTAFGLVLGVSFASNIQQIRDVIQHIVGRDLFAPEIYFLTQLPARIEIGEVVSVVLMALGLSFAATLYPAWRAANLDPVEALRYE